MCGSHIQSCDIRWTLGCVNPATWLPLATGRQEFTQPRAHLLVQLCIRLAPIFGGFVDPFTPLSSRFIKLVSKCSFTPVLGGCHINGSPLMNDQRTANRHPRHKFPNRIGLPSLTKVNSLSFSSDNRKLSDKSHVESDRDSDRRGLRRDGAGRGGHDEVHG